MSGITKKFLLLLLIASASAFAQNEGEAEPALDAPDHYQFSQYEIMMENATELLGQGEAAEAEVLFLEALQVSKANAGVDSVHQLPALGGLIQALQAQERWDSMNKLLDYFEWLSNKNRQISLESYLHSLRLLSDLNLEIAGDTRNPNSAMHLVNAKNYNWRAVTAIEAEYGKKDPEVVPWLYRIVLSHFHQSTLVKRRGITSYEYKGDSRAIVPGFAIPKKESLQKSYGIGQELLQRIADIRDDSGDPWSQAIARVYQADWEMLFDKPEDALDHYKHALALLQIAGTSWNDINAFFTRTVVLPAQEAPGLGSELRLDMRPPEFVAWSDNFPGAQRPQLATAFNSQSHSAITARFQFSTNGELAAADKRALPATVSDVIVDRIEPNNPLVRQLALRYFSQLQLRPRFENGVQKRASGLSLYYRFPGNGVAGSPAAFVAALDSR